MNDSRRIHRIALLLLVAFCFLGYQKEPEKVNETVEEEGQEEDFFDLAEMKKNGQNVQANFSFGVDNYDEDKCQIPYDGGELQVDFKVSPTDCSFDCSVLIYIDGILQQYALEPQGTRGEQHTVKVDDQDTVISAYFTPQIDKNKKKHRMHFLCMYDPEWKPEKENSDYGNSHKISQMLPWDLVINGDCGEAEDKTASEHVQVISKEKRKEYDPGSDNGQGDNQLDGSICFETERGQKENEITFRVLGGPAAEYRISAYAGHKLIDFSNGAKYIDLSLDSKHMYEGSISIDGQTVQEYDTLYFMAVPVSNLGTAMVWKSGSMCLYQGGLLDAGNE